MFIKFLSENLTKKHYVGNCVNSFDDDGDCIIPQLPYNTTSDFAYAEENYTPIDKDTFDKNVSVPTNFSFKNHKLLHDKENDVFVSYDTKKDIHHFFT